MRILITGGSGSLGNALVRHYLETTSHEVIVFSRDELKQAEMRERFSDPRLDFFLGCVRDLPRLKLAFDAKIDVVIHAAALKRVDSTAKDPDEVFATNVLGSRNVLQASRGRVSQCLLISTDKACYPTNAYGLSKAMAESLFTSFSVYHSSRGTRAGVVRYGNVFDSRGSVVSVWAKFREEGLPFPLTHPEMTRFLITFPQAISLIDHALASMSGGEVFVPRLPAHSLVDLGQAMRDWLPKKNFTLTGLRPGGEKLHETLLTGEEILRAQDEGPYVRVFPPFSSPHHGALRPSQSLQPERWVSQWAPKLSVEALKGLLDGT